MVDQYLKSGVVFLSSLFMLLSGWVLAADISAEQRPEFTLTLKNHLFYPQTITIPANKKVKLIIYNQDDTAEEFDSFDLNREKVIFPHQHSVIFIGPLPAGRYDFFGEFNPNSARGVVIVEDPDLNRQAIKSEVNNVN